MRQQVTRDNQQVGESVPASMRMWSRDRKNGFPVPETLAIEWYVYERANLYSQLDYDDRCRLFSSPSFITKNSLPTNKEILDGM